MKLIVGLGNPGENYKNTRHNVGFIAIDRLIEEFTQSQQFNKFNGEAWQTIFDNEKIIFLKPQTFMNLSGECIVNFLNYYKIDIKNLLIIYDDKDLDLNKSRWKNNGSSGGHNGIKSIVDHIKTENFCRLKIGIGSPILKNISIAKWVLSKFSDDEIACINKKIDENIGGIKMFIDNDDFLKIMNNYN